MADIPDFKDDLKAYLRWRDEHPAPFNPHWCAAHWAPCPVEGLNGILASIVIIGEAFAFVPPNVRSPRALNSWFANQVEPTCCKLGDEKMDFLWDLVRRVGSGEVCGNATDIPNGRHVCFYPPGHDGPHEQHQPAASIFKAMGPPLDDPDGGRRAD